MKTYNEYKDSGIEWIGRVPFNWKVSQLKFTCNIQGRVGYKGYTVSDLVSAGEGPYTIGAKHISKKNKLDLSSPEYISWNKYYESPEIMVFEGDLLLTQRGTLGKVVLIEENIGEATINPSMVILNKLTCSGKYLYYFFNSDYFSKWVELTNTATAVPMISQEQLGNFKILIPSNSEQVKISQYLDQKITQVDKLIVDKQKLIELLNEERTAVINQAVTKGIAPDVPMKDSGIDWLGEVPKHWKLKRVKNIVNKIGSGVTPKGGAEVYLESGIPLIRSQNVYFDGFRLNEVAYIDLDVHNDMSNSKVYPNDVLLNITGGSIGRCYYVSNEFTEANVNQHVCILRPNELTQAIYLYNFLRSQIGQLQIELCQIGGNRESVNFEQLKNFFIPLPSSEEQAEIIDFINSFESKIISLIKKEQKEIDLLKEYKTALISEVVTGKVDVRNEVLTDLTAIAS